jgi:hypothetical protein
MVVTNEIFIAGFAAVELLIVIGTCLLVRELRSWRKEMRADRQKWQTEREANKRAAGKELLSDTSPESICRKTDTLSRSPILWGPAYWMPGEK